MNAKTTTIRRQLNPRLDVEMIVGRGFFDCIWLPNYPDRAPTPKERQIFRRAMCDAALEMLRLTIESQINETMGMMH